MLIAAILVGAVLLMAGVNNTWGQLGGLAKDVIWPAKGSGFLLWVFAILFLMTVLRALNLPEAGKALVVLIVVAFLLGHTDIPGQILSAVKASGQGAAPGATAPGASAPVPGGLNAAPGSSGTK